MKKILVGLVVTSLFLVLQLAPVYGNGFAYKERLAGVMDNVVSYFDERDGFISRFLNKPQEDQYKRMEEDLELIYEELYGTMVHDLNQYKGSYLLNLTENGESTLLNNTFVAYTKQKNNEIESEIKEDIVAYLSEILEEDHNEIKNRKGE